MSYPLPLEQGRRNGQGQRALGAQTSENYEKNFGGGEEGAEGGWW